MKTLAESYFELLFEFDPKTIGGKLPAEDFYYAFTSSPFGGRLLAAATEAADAADHVLLMMDLGHRTERAAEAIAALESRRVDAIIYATMGFTQLDEPPVSRVPLVLANCVTREPGRPSVSPDDAGGAAAQ